MRVIGGISRSIKLKSPAGKETRPTSDRVREALFNIIGQDVNNALFVDGFAGSGAVGVEALSRGARHCIFIEKRAHCVKIIKENLQQTNFAEKAEIIKTDIFAGFKHFKKKCNPADFIFLDPPYGSSRLTLKLIELIVSQKLIAEKGVVIVEHSKEEDFEDIEKWAHVNTRYYGNTAISFLKEL